MACKRSSVRFRLAPPILPKLPTTARASPESTRTFRDLLLDSASAEHTETLMSVGFGANSAAVLCAAPNWSASAVSDA